MQDDDALLKEFRKNFQNHKIVERYETDHVQRFRFSQPDTWEYGFWLTCADNLIVMNGDCYTLVLEPGYGRSGLAFLLSNVCRDGWGYFLGKVPYKFETALTEYSLKQAKANLHDAIEQGYEIPLEVINDFCDDEGSYYELCSELDIDDPSSPRILTKTTINQIAGLQVFAEAYKAAAEVKT